MEKISPSCCITVMEYLLMQEKKAIKEEKMKQEEKYMWAVVDGVKEKVISSLYYFSSLLY